MISKKFTTTSLFLFALTLSESLFSYLPETVLKFSGPVERQWNGSAFTELDKFSVQLNPEATNIVTYRFWLKKIKNSSDVWLYIPRVDQCYQVFWKGEEVTKHGTLNSLWGMYEGHRFPLPDNYFEEPFTLIARSKTAKIGVPKSFWYGSHSAILLKMVTENFIPLILSVFYAVIALVTLVLSINKVRRELFVPFSFFSIALAMFTFCTTDTRNLFESFSAISGQLKLLSLFALPVGLLRVLVILSKKGFSKYFKFVCRFFLIFFLLSIPISFLSPFLLFKLLTLFQLSAFLGSTFIIASIVIGSKTGHLARYILIGIVPLPFFIAHDIFVGRGMIDGRELFPIGIFIFYGALLFALMNELFQLFLRTRKQNLTLEMKKEKLSESSSQIQALYEEIRETRKEILYKLSSVVESRSHEDEKHIYRVSLFSQMIARELGYSEEDLERLKVAVSLHDLGKVAIPDTVLLSTHHLTPEEMETMKEHTTLGHSMLSHSDDPILQMGAQIALSHHERYDGKGYPNQIKGDEIDPFSRIVTLADTLESMTTIKAWRRAISFEDAATYIATNSRLKFHPTVVDAFLRIKNDFSIIFGELPKHP